MKPESQKIIREILDNLDLNFNEDHDNTYRPRFQIEINQECTKNNIFLNIPKNVNFVYQLLFEKGDLHSDIREQIAKYLGYSEGRDKGEDYLSIYLPKQSRIPITKENIPLIRDLIKKETKKVRSYLSSN